jgi:hypothetical protein
LVLLRVLFFWQGFQTVLGLLFNNITRSGFVSNANSQLGLGEINTLNVIV